MIALDPSQTVTASLASDRHLPDEQRPCFVGHHLTAAEWLRCDQHLELAGKANDNAKGLEHLLNAFKVILIGWRHVVNRKGDPVEFRVEELADLLTMRELWELIYELLNAMRLKEDDLKNSDSRPVCASVPSAVTAPE